MCLLQVVLQTGEASLEIDADLVDRHVKLIGNDPVLLVVVKAFPKKAIAWRLKRCERLREHVHSEVRVRAERNRIRGDRIKGIAAIFSLFGLFPQGIMLADEVYSLVVGDHRDIA